MHCTTRRSLIGNLFYLDYLFSFSFLFLSFLFLFLPSSLFSFLCYAPLTFPLSRYSTPFQLTFIHSCSLLTPILFPSYLLSSVIFCFLLFSSHLSCCVLVSSLISSFLISSSNRHTSTLRSTFAVFLHSYLKLKLTSFLYLRSLMWIEWSGLQIRCSILLCR